MFKMEEGKDGWLDEQPVWLRQPEMKKLSSQEELEQVDPVISGENDRLYTDVGDAIKLP